MEFWVRLTVGYFSGSMLKSFGDEWQRIQINQLQSIDAIKVANIDGQKRQIVYEAGGGNKRVFNADLKILSNQAHVQFAARRAISSVNGKILKSTWSVAISDSLPARNAPNSIS